MRHEHIPPHLRDEPTHMELFEEMKILFPENAVSYFVSYYDYYQPESYIPSTDKYIEKDSAINPQN